MAEYRTVSKLQDLVGSMEVVGGVVKSYTSDTLKQGVVVPMPGPGLRFRVTFSGLSKQYIIRAYGFPGVGYLGASKDEKVTVAAEEPWAATASTFVMFDDESDEYTDKAANDNATTAAV